MECSTRPSNVRVCQFRHFRISETIAPDAYYFSTSRPVCQGDSQNFSRKRAVFPEEKAFSFVFHRILMKIAGILLDFSARGEYNRSITEQKERSP